MDVYFLQCRESGRVFIHCTACGCAWNSIPPSNNVDSIDPPDKFARRGITLPTLKEIQAAGFDCPVEVVDGIEPEEEFWNLFAISYIETDDCDRAIRLLSAVIENHHQPPAEAFYKRAIAFERLGRSKQAFDDYERARSLKWPTWLHELRSEPYTRREAVRISRLAWPTRGDYCEKCHRWIPSFAEISSEEESRLRRLPKIQAIKVLTEKTSCPPKFAKIWVLHPNGPEAPQLFTPQ